ncbi:hypothetical protein [Acidisoma sp. 7E03]
MRRVEDGSHLPRPGFCVAVEPDVEPAALPEGLDERTLFYIEQARPVFDRIGRVSAQLSGLLILAATGARSAQGHPMFALIAEGREALAAAMAILRPPPSAAHHHHHLRRAAVAVARAVDLAEQRLHRRDDALLDRLTAALRAANQELHWATNALPGFAVVDLRQACCAAHSQRTHQTQ